MYEIQEFMEIYFTSSKYARHRELLAMTSYLTITKLRVFAEVFNNFLIASGKDLNEEGVTIKQDSDWARHFKSWLGKQNTNVNPKN